MVQLAVWYFYKAWWVLPAFGVLVGYATNWFALNIIFRPLKPVRIGPWTIQGLFLKRQKGVAAVWCRLVTTEILTVQQMIYAMMYGPKSDATRALIRKHITPVVDQAVEAYRPVAGLAVGDGTLTAIAETGFLLGIADSHSTFLGVAAAGVLCDEASYQYVLEFFEEAARE